MRAGVAALLCVYGSAVESTAQTYIRLKNRRDDTLWQELVAFPAVCFDVLVEKTNWDNWAVRDVS